MGDSKVFKGLGDRDWSGTRTPEGPGPVYYPRLEHRGRAFLQGEQIVLQSVGRGWEAPAWTAPRRQAKKSRSLSPRREESETLREA